MLDRISVVIVTKNAADNLQHCLGSLSDFPHILIVDSYSIDDTAEIAESLNIPVISFAWNGQYPKKRQWCLDHLTDLKDYVLFIDADEIMTPALVEDMRGLSGDKAGYFINGQYVFRGKKLRYGLRNNKLCLINRHQMEFPVVDDLDLDAMDEIEGHYQPVLKEGETNSFGALKSPLIHDAYNTHWFERHERYAYWQAMVEHRQALPSDVTMGRQILKSVFGIGILRPFMAFFHSYILKLGFLDGRAGYQFALSRARYYRMVNANIKKVQNGV